MAYPENERWINARRNGGSHYSFTMKKGDSIEPDDTIRQYYLDVGNIPLLTAQQEIELAKRIEAGRLADEEILKSGDQASQTLSDLSADGKLAHEALVEANTRLVISMAIRHVGQGVPFIDLIQEGNIGLMRAADKFDWRRGNKFSTYATWWIRQAVTRALSDQGCTIRVPVHMNDRIRKVYAVASALEQELGREPTHNEIALAAGISIKKVVAALRFSSRPISLETPVGKNKDNELGNVVEDAKSPNPEVAAALSLLKHNVEEVLQGLSAREQRVLALRYGLQGYDEYTLEEVGDIFDLTRERIRQIETEALRKLRDPNRADKLREYLK